MLFLLLYAVFFVPLYLMLRISLHSEKWLLCLFLITGSVHAFAQQAKWNQRYQTYIDQYRDMVSVGLQLSSFVLFQLRRTAAISHQ